MTERLRAAIARDQLSAWGNAYRRAAGLYARYVRAAAVAFWAAQR